MSILEDQRVQTVGRDFHVTISHGMYLVEHDDRDGLWWAFNEGRDGRRLDHRDDPLRCSSDACSGWDTAEELIAVLLSFDGEAVPA